MITEIFKTVTSVINFVFITNFPANVALPIGRNSFDFHRTNIHAKVTLYVF
jgi:hypothetical protein